MNCFFCLDLPWQRFAIDRFSSQTVSGLLFNDLEAERSILKAKHPRDTQRIGRGVKGFDGNVWDKHRFDIVVQGNLAKFGQNEPFKEFL